MPRFSANLGFLFTEQPFLDRFAAAARAGFTAVEIADPYAHSTAALADRLRANHLTCALINLPMGDPGRGEKGLTGLPDRVVAFRDSVRLAIEIARALGCSRANCMAGRPPADADPALVHATLVDNVRFAARAFAAAGLTLCLEALNTIEVPGFLLHGSQQVAALIREVGEPNVKLQFDCYHMELMEGGLAASLAQLLPLIGHIQFADVPGRHEPGTGRIDYAALFAHLDRLGYRGWVGAEYRPCGQTADSLGWMETPGLPE
jgi:hydroxypyruvate isomerase